MLGGSSGKHEVMVSGSQSIRVGLSVLRPMPPRLLGAVALVVLFAGAAYCLGYELLRSGAGQWRQSLIWSACAVLPWLALFEGIKRREWRTGRRLSGAAVGLLLTATTAVSLLLEGFSDLLAGSSGAPLALQLLRRLPAAAATILLLLLARQAIAPMRGRVPRVAAEDGIDQLRGHAASIRWIRAADNYLEVHLADHVWTRRLTMREAEAALAPLGFVRIHRSFIVNGAFVAQVGSNADAKVRMADGTLLPGGKAFSENLRRLENFATSPQSN